MATTSPSITDLYRRAMTAYVADDRMAEAAGLFREVLAAVPDSLDVRLHLASTLWYLGRYDDARTVLIAEPFQYEPWADHGLAVRDDLLGTIQKSRGQLEDAERWFQSATKRDWNLYAPRVHLATLRLEQGDLSGWAGWDWRRRSPRWHSSWGLPTTLQWDGSPLEGRTLLVAHEEGIGDQILLARYLPALVAQADGRVIVETHAAIAGLVRDSLGLEVIAHGAPRPEHDVWLAFASVPRRVGATWETTPPPPYLHTDPALVESWRERLNLDPRRLNVGIVRAASNGHLPLGTRHDQDTRRTVPADALAPLGRLEGVNWYSLQTPVVSLDGLAPVPEPTGLDVVSLGDQLMAGDFRDTAAVVSLLDAVVVADCAAANLVGALGLPGIVMLARPCDWRWGLDADTTPWFPSLTLVRQDRPNQWEPVVGRVADHLSRLVAERQAA